MVTYLEAIINDAWLAKSTLSVDWQIFLRKKI